jgi:aromatic-L-amino-acid decarboxylase
VHRFSTLTVPMQRRSRGPAAGRFPFLGAAQDPADLELSAAQTTSAVTTALRHILAHQAGLAGSPIIGDISGEGLYRFLPREPSRAGQQIENLLDTFFDELVPRSYNTAAPGHFGWIPAGGLFPAALADLVAGATNRYTGMTSAAPALVALEADVLRWFCDWVGYPPQARGLFTTGGSMATFGAIVCAREALIGVELGTAVVYTSAQSHHSVAKACRLAGLRPELVRQVAVDARFRMRPDALLAAIRADRVAGRQPFLVIATAGTTTTGAVDPLADVADIATAEGLWLHVDAAYGGFFALCPELAPLLGPLARADSLTLDPHKSLFLPYGTGALLVRDGELLRQAHADTASYLPPPPADGATYDPSQYGPSLSRDYPGLRVWLSVQTFGVDRLTAALREKWQLAAVAARAVAEIEGLSLVADPELSLFAFHVARPTAAAATRQAVENADTERLIQLVCAGGRTLLTGCRIDGRYYARICVLSFRTRAKHVDRLIADVTAAVAELFAGQGREPAPVAR